MSRIYAIQLLSKYTGDHVWLGIPHPNRESAREYAEKEVCARCNRIEIHSFPDDWEWIDRKAGFRPINSLIQERQAA